MYHGLTYKHHFVPVGRQFHWIQQTEMDAKKETYSHHVVNNRYISLLLAL